MQLGIWNFFFFNTVHKHCRKLPNLRVCLRPRGETLWFCEPHHMALDFEVSLSLPCHDVMTIKKNLFFSNSNSVPEPQLCFVLYLHYEFVIVRNQQLTDVGYSCKNYIWFRNIYTQYKVKLYMITLVRIWTALHFVINLLSRVSGYKQVAFDTLRIPLLILTHFQ